MKGVRIVLPLWAMLSVSATTAPAQVVPDYDFDWVTIGDVNNPPYEGETPFGGTHTLGRGSVPYEYRISRTEVTTGQWMEFVNTFSTQSDELRFFADPIFWGAEPDPTYTGPGRRWRLRSDVPNPKILPVGGISWRESAQFANWLHNGKGSDLSTLVTGAYDSTTWGDVGGRFTDDPTHLPGARFWIPTLDEWLKAVHYDPNKYGQGQGGWWAYPYASDDVPISGFPEDGGETSAGILCTTCAWDVALGAYADQQTPWGLLDASGGSREWIEEVLFADDPRNRGLAGAEAAAVEWFRPDHVSIIQSGGPGSPPASFTGLRLVSLVPESPRRVPDAVHRRAVPHP